jgi:hypothetical protein
VSGEMTATELLYMAAAALWVVGVLIVVARKVV